MKNLFKLLMFSLVLFLGSCANVVEEATKVDPTNFLGKVLNKTMYMDSIHSEKRGSFSEDGKTFTMFSQKTPIFVFIKSSGPNSATYETVITEEAPTMQNITVYTADGMSGSLNSDIELLGMWLKSTAPDFDPEGIEKNSFLTKVIGKTISTVDGTVLGAFSTDGLTFTGTPISKIPVVTFLRMKEKGVAEFKDTVNKIYTFTATDADNGFVDVGDGVKIPILLTAFDADGLEKTVFINNVQTKTIYDNGITQDITTALGTFSTDGETFAGTISRGIPKLTFNRMIAVGTAIFIDTAGNIYTFTATDGSTGFVEIGGTKKSVWLKAFDNPAVTAAKDAFIAAVQNKNIYNNDTTQNITTAFGTFSTDGLTFTGTALTDSVTLTFSKMTTLGTAEYTGSSTTYTFSTADGTIGLVNFNNNALSISIYFKTFTAGTEETAFKNSVQGKTTYPNVEHTDPIGVFNNDGTTFTIQGGATVLNFSKMTTLGTAEYTGAATYTFTTANGTTGTIDIGGGTKTLIWLGVAL